MTLTLGNLLLCAAVLTAVATVLFAIRAARTGADTPLRAASYGIYALAGLTTLASALLMFAMLAGDFRLEYVAHYTERALPVGYKAAAFWAGQQGSLLLWAWLLSAMSAAFVFFAPRNDLATAVAAGTLATVIGFFASLMLFAANPFHPAETILHDGQGLNPMLQDPWMMAHPPILFVGYAGFTIPFAILAGALVTGKLDSDWLVRARPWAMVSWIFLGAGILLGARWAYAVLGWGGYWAWDPVENASLLPWLTATAMIHSAIVQRQRGIFRRWTAVLTAVTFLLCVLGTYITRSGVVDSVHSFGESLVGTFFGAFLLLVTGGTVALLARRWNDLAPQRTVATWVSREGMFLGINLLFLAMTVITMFGTLFPAISRPLTGQPLSVSQSFYNRAVLPLGLLLLPLIALSPTISYGRETMKKLVRALGVPVLMSTLSVGVLWSLHVRSVWALAAAVMGTVVIGSILLDVVTSVRARVRNTAEPVLAATFRLLDANHRRYGSHVVHAGIVMIVAGIAGSSLYGTKQLVPLAPDGTVTVGRYALRLNSIGEAREANFSAVRAEISAVAPDGSVMTLHPERRFYDKSEEANTQVAIRSNWREDLYVTLAGWEPGGRVVTFQVIVNPLVRWIWAGGLVLVFGAVWCLLPRLAGRAAPVAVQEEKVDNARKAHSRKPVRRRNPAVAGA